MLGHGVSPLGLLPRHHGTTTPRYSSDPQEPLATLMVIQVYAPTSAEEAEVEPFYEDLQDLLKLTPKKDILFIIGDWNAKIESK